MKAQSCLLKPLLLTLALLLGTLLHTDANADLLVVVNEQNPVESLTLKEVKQLFLGRMRRFPGVDRDVDVLDREESSVIHRDFYQQVVSMDPTRLKRYRARYLFSGQGRLPAIVVGQDNLIDKIRSNVSAVGYVELPEGASLPRGVKVVYREVLPDHEVPGNLLPGESERAADIPMNVPMNPPAPR